MEKFNFIFPGIKLIPIYANLSNLDPKTDWALECLILQTLVEMNSRVTFFFSPLADLCFCFYPSTTWKTSLVFHEIQRREDVLMIPSAGAQVLRYLRGGPAGHTGPGPTGSQPVSHPEQAGLRPQHGRGNVQAEGHAVVAPCGEKNPLTQPWHLFILGLGMSHAKIATLQAALPEADDFRRPFALPGMAKSHSGTSCSATGRRDIQSVIGPSWSRSSSPMFFKVATASLLASLPRSRFRVERLWQHFRLGPSEQRHQSGSSFW